MSTLLLGSNFHSHLTFWSKKANISKNVLKVIEILSTMKENLVLFIFTNLSFLNEDNLLLKWL